MRMLKKRIDNIEFITDMLAHSSTEDTCHFCKYNIKNYIEYDETAAEHFKLKCIHCIHFKRYQSMNETQKESMKHRIGYLEDMNKPLYNWQEEEE